MADLVRWAGSYFQETTGGRIEHPDLGQVRLDERSAKDSLAHGYGPNKVQALYLLPEALPKAIVLAGELQKSGHKAYVLAAPVSIGGRTFILASLVRNVEGNVGLYVHEAVLLEKLQGAINTAASAGLEGTGELTQGNPGAIRKILSDVFAVNEDDGRYSTAGASGAGMSASALDSHLRDGRQGEVVAALLESGQMVIHETEDTLPPHPPQSAPIQGLTDKDGTIHLVAEHLTEETAEPVLLHEAFQARGESLLGQGQWRNLLARLDGILERQKAKPDVERLRWWRDAIRRMEAAGTPASLRAEEMAAYAIEHRAKAPAGVQAVVDNLIGHVKAWLLRRFGTQLGAVTPGQLRALAIAALRQGQSGSASRQQERSSRPEALREPPRQFGVPQDASQTVSTFRNDRPLKAHPDYAAAKGGDRDAAGRLVPDLVRMENIEAADRRFGPGVIYAPVLAIEQDGRNKLPSALAHYYASRTGASVSEDIVQANRAFHTGAKAMDRLIARPLFDGSVQAGGRYVIVDDVTVMGATLAEMANHIRRGGGSVVGVVTLVNAGRSGNMAVEPQRAREIDRRFGNVVREELRLDPQSLTADEADYLLNFRDADALRTRIAAARDERSRRLLSKGVRPSLINEAPEGRRVTDNGVRFSLADTSKPATPAEQDRWLSKLLSDTLNRAMPTLLRTVPLRPMLEELGKDLPAAQAYLKTKQEMDALRDSWHDKAAKVSQRWQSYLARNGEENKRLMAIMHEATLGQVDPSEPFAPRFGAKEATALRYGTDEAAAEAARKIHEEDKARKAAWRDLQQRYEALSDEARSIFVEVRDAYSAQADASETAILANMEKAIGIAERQAQRKHAKEMRRIADQGLAGAEREAAIKAADKALKAVQTKMRWNLKYRISRMREQFEANRLSGPYFPLSRFGDYFVTVRDRTTGKVASFSRFETPRKQRLFAEEMGRDPNVEVQVGVLSEDDGARGAVDPRFLADIDELLAGAAVPDELRDDIHQRYLATLPDFSLRKNRIHRQGRAGFQEDALRAFASNLFHGAHQLARLQHGMDLDEHINEAEEQAQEAPDPVRAGWVVKEMKKRNAYLKNPQGAAWAQHVSTAAFVYHLGASPASALVNLSQTVVIGVPVLGAYVGGAKGMARANAQILRATRDFAMGKGYAENASQLTADEKAAMVAGYAMSVIQRTQSHDLAGVGEVGVAFSGRREQVMKAVSIGFHQAERFNREVTFLAAYRLARVKGESHADAIQTAARLTWKTHYDYQNTSRPGFMQDDKVRVALAFRNYTINTLFRLFRDTHQALYGADAQTRREARTQLYGITAMMTLNAGIRGTWLFGVAMTLAGIFFGLSGRGEDDPEEELQKAVVGLLGPTLGGMALNGIPGHLLGISLSERIGMPDLWFRSPERQLEGKEEYYYWMSQMLGAAFAIPENAFRGVQLISDGHVYRGIETVMPKAMRDLMKSYRWMTEGANTLKGDPIVDDVAPADLLRQAIGFTPAQIAEQYQLNTWMRNRADKIQAERKGILNDYARAFQANDRAGMERAEKSIGPYNERHAYYPILGKDPVTFIKRRQSASERTEDGLMLPQKLNEHVRGNSAPPIYR